MTDATHKELIDELLKQHGQTFSDELGIKLDRGTPAPLFQWLCAALLMSARISADKAINAAAALKEAGMTTVEKMTESSWEDRVKVLNGAGYARYDESTARMLGDTVEMLQDDYAGDLRQLRERAECDAGREKKLLKEFKGIGDVGADIFLREVQAVWDEVYPFADDKALAAAKNLGLPGTAEELATLVTRDRFPRLLAALIRADLADDLDEVTTTAQEQ